MLANSGQAPQVAMASAIAKSRPVSNPRGPNTAKQMSMSKRKFDLNKRHHEKTSSRHVSAIDLAEMEQQAMII